MIGKPLRLLERAQSHRREKTGIDPATVFGDVPVENLKPEYTAQTLPDYFELKEGTFFEVAALHVLASGSVEHLADYNPGQRSTGAASGQTSTSRLGLSGLASSKTRGWGALLRSVRLCGSTACSPPSGA